MTSEIEKRMNQREYESLFNDCTWAYFKQRNLLLHSAVTTQLALLLSDGVDLIDMVIPHPFFSMSLILEVRNAGGYLIVLARLEHGLYYSFFSRESPGLLYLFQ